VKNCGKKFKIEYNEHMIITYLGAESCKIQFGDTTIACNPVSKESKLKQAKYGSDIVMVTAHNPDFNGIEQVTHGERTPFVIDGPGEYEVKGVFIKGLPSVTNYSKNGTKGEEKINTIYTITLESMNICFLGAISSPELKSQTIEELDEIDVLFVPIGGDGVLDPRQAYRLAVSLEPKIIIPIHYGEIGTEDALKVFLKEAGEKNPQTVAKLTLKRKDLEGKNASVVVLESSKE